jgi:hypothetical protein
MLGGFRRSAVVEKVNGEEQGGDHGEDEEARLRPEFASGEPVGGPQAHRANENVFGYGTRLLVALRYRIYPTELIRSASTQEACPSEEQN